jgi:hypothetical protein
MQMKQKRLDNLYAYSGPSKLVPKLNLQLSSLDDLPSQPVQIQNLDGWEISRLIESVKTPSARFLYTKDYDDED